MNVLDERASVDHLNEMENISFQRPQQGRKDVREKDASNVAQFKTSKRVHAIPV